MIPVGMPWSATWMGHASVPEWPGRTSTCTGISAPLPSPGGAPAAAGGRWRRWRRPGPFPISMVSRLARPGIPANPTSMATAASGATAWAAAAAPGADFLLACRDQDHFGRTLALLETAESQEGRGQARPVVEGLGSVTPGPEAHAGAHKAHDVTGTHPGAHFLRAQSEVDEEVVPGRRL